MADSESERDDESGSDEDLAQRSTESGRKASKQRKCQDGEAERDQFFPEGMLLGVLDENEEDALEGMTQLRGRAKQAELRAQEMYEYSRRFFKRKDVKQIFNKKDEYGNRIIKHPTYAKEFLVWCFWSSGDTADDDDNENTDNLKTYLEILVQRGRDARGIKLSQIIARDFKFIANPAKLEDFLREYFIKYRQRLVREEETEGGKETPEEMDEVRVEDGGEMGSLGPAEARNRYKIFVFNRTETKTSASRAATPDMIMGVIDAAQDLRALETLIHRIAFPQRQDPPTTRTPSVLYLQKQTHLMVSEMRRICLEDVLVGTIVTRNASEELLKILQYCFKKGTFEHVRLGTHESMGTALVLRSQNMEHLDLNYIFRTTLGDTLCNQLSCHEALAAMIDKSKVKRIGHKYIAGCVHHLEAIRDAMFWLGLYLLMCWTPVAKGGIGGNHPNLADAAQWFGTPLLREAKHINNKTRMRPESSLKAIKAALMDPECLNLSGEEAATFGKRHSMRHNSISILEDMAVDPQNQNSFGKWEMDKRNQNYACYMLSRTAVLAMGWTPKNDLGSQAHKPTWNLVKASESLKTIADSMSSE